MFSSPLISTGRATALLCHPPCELLARGAVVDAAINDGTTPLTIASFMGHVDVVRALLARGATVNRVMHSGATPLSYAR